MTTAETRAAQQLGTTEEGLKRIQAAHKLFSGLWDDDAFIELWKSIPDDACSALIAAAEKLEKAEERIAALTQSQTRLVAQMAAEYYENGTTKTRDVAIKEVGPHAFYCALVRCIDEIDAEDTIAIIKLIKD